MKTVCKKLLCLMLVAMLLVSAAPFAFAAGSAQITLQLHIDGEPVDTATINVNATDVLGERDLKAFARSEWPTEFNVNSFEAVSPKGLDMSNGDATVNVYLLTPEAPEAPEEPQEPETPACEHKNVTTGVQAATCTDAGIEIERCDSCGKIVSQKEIPALGHKEGEDGKCTTCGEVLSTPTKPSYGTLKVTVYIYNSNNEAKEAGTVKFTGKASYTLGKNLAEECFEEVGVVNYEEYRWKGASGTLDMTDGQSYNVNLVVDPVYTPGNRKIVYLTLNHNRGNGNDDRQVIELLAGEKILTAINKAEDEDIIDLPTRKGYTLAGWSFDMNCSEDVNRDDVITKDMTIYAEWERIPENKKYDVALHIYTNNDSVYVDKVVDMESYAKDGKITQAEVEKVVKARYTAKSGYSLAFDGLFTAKTWDDGDYDTDDAVATIYVDEDEKVDIYVMVRNVKKAVADSSNPKTGDNIMIAATTMALAGAALVSLVELKKRKMI